MTSRQSSFLPSEDVLLVQVYMEVSQDPIIGMQQTGDNFWARVHQSYNESAPAGWVERPFRSIKTRMQKIEKAVRKLIACVKQVKNRNPSGASEVDLLNYGKELLKLDEKYNKGFPYDHVWHLLKDYPKYQDGDMSSRHLRNNHTESYESSEYEVRTPESQTPDTLGLDDLNTDLNCGDVGGSSSKRPIGIKKAKHKKAMGEKSSAEDKHLIEVMEKAREDRAKLFAFQQEKFAFKREMEADRIMNQNLSQIENIHQRAHVQARQAQIVAERAKQHQQPPPSTPGYSDFFPNIYRDGGDLPDY